MPKQTKTGKKRKKRKAKNLSKEEGSDAVEVEVMPGVEVLDAQARILSEIASDLRKLSELIGIMAEGQTDYEEVS